MSDAPATTPPSKRRRFAPLMIVAGLASAIVLSLSMTSTLSAFVAAITNTTDTAAVGTLSLVETAPDGTTKCTSTGSTAVNCGSINKYGGNTAMVPGTTTSTTTVTFTNPGTTAANSFTLTPAACKSTPATAGTGDLCTKLNVTITAGGKNLYTGTAAALTAPIALTNVPGAANNPSVAVTFAVTVDASADNTFQGTSASQPLTWTLST